ncbi:MAG: sigma-70 family RNA polymerase sigma factor [Caldilineaceae bacterium]|nr:sigma-70 family RNA polymerase sigma factor [Caldilineaceae bacterium]
MTEAIVPIRDDERNDGALLVACRRGDATAWESLVNRYQRLIYAIPRRAGLDDDQCADVFQRTFALLVEHLDRIDQPDRVRAWLVTTARREAQRTRQRAARTQPFPTAEDEEATGAETALPDPAPLPDAAILQLEEQHLVRTALAQLDERCRQLLTLLFYRAEPATYDEITTTVGMAAGSIGPTRARCLQKLGRLLKESGF